MVKRTQRQEKSGLSVAGMVTGITGCFAPYGLISLVALALSVAALNTRDGNNGFAITGLITALVGLAKSLIIWVWILSLL